MSLYNDLMSSAFDNSATAEDLDSISSRAEDAANDLVMGISAIGSMMFWAAASNDYPEETAKKYMYRIGAMLGTVGEVVRAMTDTAAGAEAYRIASVSQPKTGAKK